MTEDLDELRRIGEELRALFAQERAAISTLDTEKLEALTEAKSAYVTRLARLREHVDARDPSVRQLFVTIRVEAQATAILAATATRAVRELLGIAPASIYDRRARQNTANLGRVLATY